MTRARSRRIRRQRRRMRFWERIRLLAEQVPPGGSTRWWWDDVPVLAFDTEASALEVIDESSTQSQLRGYIERWSERFEAELKRHKS